MIARTLRTHSFRRAILFKNSFASALACFLAQIPSRIGYAREGRSILLTDRLYPAKLPNGKFKPASMVDYYLAIAAELGADTADSKLGLSVDAKEKQSLLDRLPELADTDRTVVVFVPGGAFGPSKCWPSERFAETADRLIANYNTTVVVSVAESPLERRIAADICDASSNELVNLAEKPLGLGELKALFSCADLVISNDTGPRHIAIALHRRVISLFGPNDPSWTDTGYENEIQLVGDVPCAPCSKPKCKESEHLCMQAITVEMVCRAADRLLAQRHPTGSGAS
jgi:heptosyltransferase-2